jgi:hypothetical protein
MGHAPGWRHRAGHQGCGTRGQANRPAQSSDERRNPTLTRFQKGNIMLSIPESINNLDANGRPAGGTVRGVGLSIDWQNGPLGRDGERIQPNGAFVETVIYAALQRIEHYQSGQFKCRENALAITKLEEALHWLNARTNRREAAKVEGTHQGS